LCRNMSCKCDECREPTLMHALRSERRIVRRGKYARTCLGIAEPVSRATNWANEVWYGAQNGLVSPALMIWSKFPAAIMTAAAVQYALCTASMQTRRAPCPVPRVPCPPERMARARAGPPVAILVIRSEGRSRLTTSATTLYCAACCLPMRAALPQWALACLVATVLLDLEYRNTMVDH